MIAWLPSGLSFMQARPPGLLRLSVLYEQIEVLLRVQFTLPAALRILSTQEENPFIRNAFLSLGRKISQGLSLSAACKEYPALFPATVLQLLQVGEEGGDLEDKFSAAAELLKRKHQVLARWKEAVTGPVITAVSFLIFIVGVVEFVLPHLVSLYDQFPIQPSLFSRGLFALIQIVRAPWLFLLAAIPAFFLLKCRHRLKEQAFVWGFQIPQTRKFIGKMLGAQFADSMASLYRNGVPLSTSLEILAKSSTPEVYAKDLQESLKALHMGETMSDALSRANYLPKVIAAMLRVGEETGKPDKLLAGIAKYMEEDCHDAMFQAAALAEPLAMAVLGALMVLVFLALLLPLYQLANRLGVQ